VKKRTNRRPQNPVMVGPVGPTIMEVHGEAWDHDLVRLAELPAPPIDHASTCRFWQMGEINPREEERARREAQIGSVRRLVTRCKDCGHELNSLPADGKIVVDEASQYAAMVANQKEVEAIALWLRYNKRAEIEAGRHIGFSLSEIVIRYMGAST